MRLTPHQINAIILREQSRAKAVWESCQWSIKGGDIDLLLLSDDVDLIENLIDTKHYLLSSIKSKLDDQKIDLMITSNDKLTEDAFLKIIFPKSLVLKQW